MSDTLARLGPMYRRLGIDTDANIVASRIEAAQAAYDEMEPTDLAPLLRMALNRAVAGDLDNVVEEVKKVDVTFDSDAAGPELILLASAILHQAIDDSSLGNHAALAVVVAAFGGLRTFEADPDLRSAAQKELTRLQDIGLPLVSPIKWSKRPVLEEDQQSLLTFAQQNNFASAHGHLKKILDSAPAYTERAYSLLTTQLNVLTSSHNRLVEMMNSHWWVTNGWSLEADCAFSDLSVTDAVVRAGVELARLTKSSRNGLFAAPALLSRQLAQSGFNPKEKIQLSDAVTGSPIGWRRDWAGSLHGTAAGPLLPITLAASLAVEANDEPDWAPRYERAAGVSPDTSVELLGLAHQVYLESLLRPHISV